MLSIVSGTKGGIVNLSVNTVDNSSCDLVFFLENESGSNGKLTIHLKDELEDVPIIHKPKQNIDVNFLLTYLKRSQQMLSCQTDYVTMYISDIGLLIHTDVKDGQCIILCTIDINDVDLDSYV